MLIISHFLKTEYSHVTFTTNYLFKLGQSIS